MFAINSHALPRHLFLAAVRKSYPDVWAAPYPCMFSCCCVLLVTVSLGQQWDYRALLEKPAQF